MSEGSKDGDGRQSHEELLASEAPYKTFLEQVPAFIYVETNDEFPRSLYVSPGAMEPWSEQYRVIARDGRVVWFRSLGVASRDEHGSVVWHGVAFDVTATKPVPTEALTETASLEPDG